MQSRVDALHKEFVAIVARNRDMEESAVDATDALCFMPEEAISRGLADEASTPEDAFTAFVAYVNSEQENEPMADQNQAGITEQAHTAAVTAARAEGVAEGASAERSRLSAILDSEEAKQRPTAARMLAFDTDKSPEAVASMLAKLPVETKGESTTTTQPAAGGAGAGAGADAFKNAMAGTENPDIDASNEDGKPLSRVQASLALAKGVAK